MGERGSGACRGMYNAGQQQEPCALQAAGRVAGGVKTHSLAAQHKCGLGQRGVNTKGTGRVGRHRRQSHRQQPTHNAGRASIEFRHGGGCPLASAVLGPSRGQGHSAVNLGRNQVSSLLHGGDLLGALLVQLDVKLQAAGGAMVAGSS